MPSNTRVDRVWSALGSGAMARLWQDHEPGVAAALAEAGVMEPHLSSCSPKPEMAVAMASLQWHWEPLPIAPAKPPWPRARAAKPQDFMRPTSVFFFRQHPRGGIWLIMAILLIVASLSHILLLHNTLIITAKLKCCILNGYLSM